MSDEVVNTIPQQKSSFIPFFLGFLLAIGIVGVAFFLYIKNQKSTLSVPSPSPYVVVLPSPSPSIEPSDAPLPTRKPSSKPVASISPTPTPIPLPTLNIRFGNPSANIKQTYDDGSGVGRVINREYTSIQVGQFDEVKSSWSPRVTVCFHVVSNETIVGKDLKFSFSLDDKIEVEDNFGQYDKMEAGRLYDWCHDVTTNIGTHSAKLLINPSKSFRETNYSDDLARVDWENLKDNIAPNYTLLGPNNEGASGTCLLPQYISDNVTPLTSLKIEQKIDSADWTAFTGSRYCFVGTQGSAHSYRLRIIDARGNTNEQNKTFNLF